MTVANSLETFSAALSGYGESRSCLFDGNRSAKQLALGFPAPDECKHVKPLLAVSEVRKSIDIAVETGEAGQHQFSLRHLAVIGRVEAEFTS